MSMASLSALIAAALLGVGLPVILAPASKSSPLLLSLAATAALGAFLPAHGLSSLGSRLRAAFATPAGVTSFALLALMAGSIPFAHAPGSSLSQFGQFTIMLLAGGILCLCFPAIAPRKRALLFACGLLLVAALAFTDLKGGLWLRNLTGGREATYTYNRPLVTLTLLIWPVFALCVAARKPWLVVPLVVLAPLAVFAGESATAVLALLVGFALFPVAFLLPRLARWLGLASTLAIIAIQPWFGSIVQRLLGQAFHERFQSAHSGDRVDIWLSFEAAARAKWFLGSGFGSSQNLQNAPVASMVPPERVTLLGSSHPHNAFLQIWVELGALGAGLAAILAVLLFRAIARMRPGLQPFVLTWFGVTASVALVSHGAWQAWWWAAIFASGVTFISLEQDLRRGEPPL